MAPEFALNLALPRLSNGLWVYRRTLELGGLELGKTQGKSQKHRARGPAGLRVPLERAEARDKVDLSLNLQTSHRT